MSSLKYDILQAKLTLPGTVYIVGTAPEDEEVINAIAKNGFTVLINEAITWDLPQKNIWFVADPNFKTKTCFNRWKQNIRNSGYDIGPDGIVPECMIVPVFAESYLETEQWVQTYFKIGTDMGLQEAGPLDKSKGVLRMQATSVGAAMQMAFYLGADKIYLVGVRLDGEYERFKPIMDWLINVLDREGVEVLYLRDSMPDEDDFELPTVSAISIRESEGVPWVIGSDLRLSKEVFIVGSGPNGNKVMKRIPEGADCIGLNRATLWPRIKFKYGLCADGDCAEREENKKWFAELLNRTKKEGIKRVWSYAVRDRAKPHKPDYIFRLCESWDPGFRQVPDKFRPDETCAGIALDLCHRQGVKHAVLIGVDMSGRKHADSSDAPGNRDDQHGAIWDSRDALDGVIRWMHNHGMRVSTLSETQLAEPYAYIEQKLPTVALLTMAYVPTFTKNALFHAYIQDYPHHLLTQYLIYQNDEQPFVATDLDIRLIQLNVSGFAWPELWLRKLMLFFENCTEDIIAIFDEDDMFTPQYISTAINALLQYKKTIVWNFRNRHMTRTSLLRENYRSPFGTMVGYRKPLFKVAKSVWYHVYGTEYPEIPEGFEWGRRGCQDATYRVMLVRQLEGVNCEVHDRFEDGVHFGLHEGERWYVEHMRTNTCSNRRDEDAIDYWIPDPWWLGQEHFEKTRLAGNILK